MITAEQVLKCFLLHVIRPAVRTIEECQRTGVLSANHVRVAVRGVGHANSYAI